MPQASAHVNEPISHANSHTSFPSPAQKHVSDSAFTYALLEPMLLPNSKTLPLLATAFALPDDGKILAIDINRQSHELGPPVIQEIGVAHKIDFEKGPTLLVLDQMI